MTCVVAVHIHADGDRACNALQADVLAADSVCEIDTRTMRTSIPITQTQRDKREVPFSVFISHALRED